MACEYGNAQLPVDVSNDYRNEQEPKDKGDEEFVVLRFRKSKNPLYCLKKQPERKKYEGSSIALKT